MWRRAAPILLALVCAGCFGGEDPRVAECLDEAERISDVRQQNAARTADDDAEYEAMEDRILEMYEDDLRACYELE